jgi:hypothetical protein
MIYASASMYRTVQPDSGQKSLGSQTTRSSGLVLQHTENLPTLYYVASAPHTLVTPFSTYAPCPHLFHPVTPTTLGTH